MKSFALFCAVILVASAHTVHGQSTNNPKYTPEKATSAPSKVVTKFTLTMTQFLITRMATEYNVSSTDRAKGFRYPDMAGDLLPNLRPGERMTFHRIDRGKYQSGNSPSNLMFFGKVDKYHELHRTDISAEMLKDMLGADAVSGVAEISASEMQGQITAAERAAIADALKRSEGNTAQAAARVGMNEIDFVAKMRQYGVGDKTR